MRRGRPLKRKRELKADAEKVREFMQRGRGQLERSQLKSKRKPRPVEGPLTPAQWREAVFRAATSDASGRVFDPSGGVCRMTGARAASVEDRRFHCHHPLPKRELRARGLYGYVWDSRNGVFLRVDVHERHEFPGVSGGRVPAAALPGSVWAFCAELDALDGTEWATSLVLRAHPAGG